MSRAALDLAARPFVNRRPVVRLSMLLWLAGAVLLAGNVWLYWDFIAGRGDLHARLRDVNEAIDVEEGRISARSGELSSFDLEAQNEQVSYLNRRIGQRRFSWSALFDDLSDLLPREVRLTSLSPSAGDEAPARSRRRQESATGTGMVELTIKAEARSDQAILDFVDALFTDPAFERPNLSRQRAQSSGVIDFDLQVLYLPGTPLEADVIELGDATLDEDEAEIVSPESDEEPETVPARRPPTGRSGPSPAPLGSSASSPPELS